ncbi:hypothetical protein TNCV_3545881 [Trichonephila clavipes]|nr:hypothetical protein TNCV_3545881 [Trichonephila clavipes]
MIETAVARITPDTRTKVWDALAYQIDMHHVTNGAHIEHFKKIANGDGPRNLDPKSSDEVGYFRRPLSKLPTHANGGTSSHAISSMHQLLYMTCLQGNQTLNS